MEHSSFSYDEQWMSFMEEIGQHMPGGFFVYKAQSPEELLFVNQATLQIFGCENLEVFQELTHNTFRGMVHPDDYPSISASITDQIDQREDNMDYVEYRIIRKDGAVRWVDDYGHYVHTEAFGGIYYVFISDITEKHEMLEALHASIQKIHAEHMTFSRIAQALAKDYFSIYVVDPDTESFVEYSSTEEYNQLGIEKSGENFFALSRKNMERLLYPDDHDRFMAVFTRERIMSILERDGIFTTKYRLMVSGQPTYISMKASLLEDANGRHLIIGTNNINAQMTREAEFQKRLIEARDRAKSDFLTNMSHDIRTPMNAIVGYTEIARAHLQDPEIVRDSLEKIASSSHFLLSLINDILDMSKIESGEIRLNIVPCDLSVILSRIESITVLQAQSKKLHITYDRSRIRHTHVMGDELRIEQTIVNIVTNAIKYTPPGKDVSFMAEETGTDSQGRYGYRFVIRDTGIGISEEYLPHIFDSFSRELKTTVNRVQGTGLGLAITAKVVELMGGTISVKSKVNEGSIFTVEIALPPNEAKEQMELSTEDMQSALAGKRILLVEDNEINAEIAILILAQYGLHTEHASDGKIALDCIQAHSPDYFSAVLMDIQMPVMNGYEATRAIRALPHPAFRTLPIIAISANAYDEDVRACLQSGMNAHVAKPFQPENLLSLLYQHIIGRHAAH
ncbi:MAG: response regulator [Clostridia bacterium]|nr:response regulator [Clostridia bacterium]